MAATFGSKAQLVLTSSDSVFRGFRVAVPDGFGDAVEDFILFVSPKAILTRLRTVSTVSYTHLTLPTTPYV